MEYNLELEYPEELLEKEFNYYKKAKGKLGTVSYKNMIIKYFQQDTFFVFEKELFNDPIIQEKLIQNRIKYLNKSLEELTVDDILTGFKRSGMYYGYSHFNPRWFKWFIEKYNVKRCYDPCGGWGHRLLGSQDLDLYIYNDLSEHTAMNVQDMVDYFMIENTVVYCEDCTKFFPQGYCLDSMFTCPPYFNIEHYECGDFESIESYNEFLDKLFDSFYNSECKIFGLVIREDLLPDKYKYDEKFLIGVNPSRHFKIEKKNQEYLYIFKK